MLYFIRLSTCILAAYFWGRIIFLLFCNPKEKNNIISKIHSFLIGLGFTSISFWLYTIATNGYNSNYHIIETCLIAFIYIYFHLKKGSKLFSLPKTISSRNKNLTEKKRSLINYLAIILFSLIAILSFYKCTQFPDGRWDAIAMWNFRAKFLALGNESWNRMYFDTCDYSHRDYPLFLPCIIARGFNYAGKIDTVIPIFFSWLFTILSFILPFLYLKRFKSKYFAVLAVCILTYSPKLISYGCVQYADIPIGVFILVSLYEFIVWNEENENLPWIGMLFAGLCFWIKNEGIPWFICYCLLIFYCLYKREKDLTSSIKNFLKTIAALLPIFISVLFVRYFAKSENDIIFGIGERLKQLFDYERYKMIIPYYWTFLKQHFWILFIPIYLLAGFIDKKYSKYKYLFIIILLMFLIYLFVYLVSPHDLFWHVDSSFDRISASYLPALVFLGCLLFDFKKS